MVRLRSRRAGVYNTWLRGKVHGRSLLPVSYETRHPSCASDHRPVWAYGMAACQELSEVSLKGSDETTSVRDALATRRWAVISVALPPNPPIC